MTIPLGPPSLTGSSDLPGSVDRTGRPNGRSHAPPYLVLLRAGFGLPRLLPAARCALTAPFHPYQPSHSPLDRHGCRFVTGSARSRSSDSGDRYKSTSPAATGGPSAKVAVYFLCHFPSGRPARVLPGALPCGVRTFLPGPSRTLASPLWPRGGHPVHCGRSPIRRSPVKSGTARASCRDCCAAYPPLRRSSRCSRRFRAVSSPDTHAPSWP